MTSLVKKSDVPDDVITEPYEVAAGSNELNKFRGKKMAILIYDDGADIELIACYRSRDLPFYVFKSGLLADRSPDDNLSLLHATVWDPSSLPYTINLDEEAFLLYDHWDYRQFSNIGGIVSTIEQIFRIYSNADIDKDFLVLIGQELGSNLLELMVSRIQRWEEYERVTCHNKKYLP